MAASEPKLIKVEVTHEDNTVKTLTGDASQDWLQKFNRLIVLGSNVSRVFNQMGDPGANPMGGIPWVVTKQGDRSTSSSTSNSKEPTEIEKKEEEEEDSDQEDERTKTEAKSKGKDVIEIEE